MPATARPEALGVSRQAKVREFEAVRVEIFTLLT
jgi:hypothetical protein